MACRMRAKISVRISERERISMKRAAANISNARFPGGDPAMTIGRSGPAGHRGSLLRRGRPGGYSTKAANPAGRAATVGVLRTQPATPQ